MELTDENYDPLTTIDGLDDTIHNDISRTTSDAMLACARVGEYQLWIDSIYIQKVCEQERKTQAKAMARIYSIAFLTLVKANRSNVDASLPDICPHTRTALAHTEIVNDLEFITCQRHT